jgi:hypothetical protein
VVEEDFFGMMCSSDEQDSDHNHLNRRMKISGKGASQGPGRSEMTDKLVEEVVLGDKTVGA